jgi:hypothetical protein
MSRITSSEFRPNIVVVNAGMMGEGERRCVSLGGGSGKARHNTLIQRDADSAEVLKAKSHKVQSCLLKHGDVVTSSRNSVSGRGDLAVNWSC